MADLRVCCCDPGGVFSSPMIAVFQLAVIVARRTSASFSIRYACVCVDLEILMVSIPYMIVEENNTTAGNIQDTISWQEGEGLYNLMRKLRKLPQPSKY